MVGPLPSQEQASFADHDGVDGPLTVISVPKLGCKQPTNGSHP
jgi:hypothetical protein